MKMITGAKLLVNTLEKLNVSKIFGIPGIHNLDIYEALVDSNIVHVTSRNESGAGFMADGFARTSGKPGVALVITGPGLTNIITPMGQAFHDSIPMVVISSQIPTVALNQGTGFLHELKNSTILAQSVAKESRTVPSAEAIGLYIEEAYHLSMSGRPGPVHIEIPMDILSSYINNTVPYYSDKNSIIKSPNPYPNKKAIKNAADMINSAQTIAIIAGGGAVNAGEEILSLSEKLSAPVLQTAAGKGIVSENHPLCLGTRLHFQAVKDMLKDTDMVIGIGTQLSPTDLWEVPLSLKGKLIQINIDAGEFNKNCRADIGIKGDAAEVLDKLIPLLDAKEPSETYMMVSDIISDTREQLEKITGIHDEMDFVLNILDAVRKALPEDAVFSTDMTTPAYAALSEFKTYSKRTFLHPVGFGTLGYALPAGIGAKLAEPDRSVCILEGDGGFQFTMQELSVAIENKISMPVIIWNNSGFGEIKRNQEARGFKYKIAVDHINPDFLKLAEAYGIKGYRVSNGYEMEQALKQSINRNEISIIEVKANFKGG